MSRYSARDESAPPVKKKIKSRIPDVWSTVPWLTSRRNGGHRRSMIDGAEQAQQEAKPQEAAPDAWVAPAEGRDRDPD